MALEQEYAMFKHERPRLLAEGAEGKFVLIKADHVVGLYDTELQAIEAGYEKFELSPFFVKKLEAVETIHIFHRPPMKHGSLLIGL